MARQRSVEPIQLTNPMIAFVVYKKALLRSTFKDMNFVELALMERSGAVALCYAVWKRLPHVVSAPRLR